MITEADRAAIDAALAELDVTAWPALNDAERDLVSRALAPTPEHSDRAA